MACEPFPKKFGDFIAYFSFYMYTPCVFIPPNPLPYSCITNVVLYHKSLKKG